MSVYDAYHRWLAIPPSEQPAHYYRLLGLALYESDPEVIRDAAEQRMAHVRTYQLGPHAETSQRILNELAAAKACLVDLQKKALYDGTLREELSRVATRLTPPPLPPPVDVRSPARRSRVWLAAAGLATLVLAGSGVLWATIWAGHHAIPSSTAQVAPREVPPRAKPATDASAARVDPPLPKMKESRTEVTAEVRPSAAPSAPPPSPPRPPAAVPTAVPPPTPAREPATTSPPRAGVGESSKVSVPAPVEQPILVSGAPVANPPKPFPPVGKASEPVNLSGVWLSALGSRYRLVDKGDTILVSLLDSADLARGEGVLAREGSQLTAKKWRCVFKNDPRKRWWSLRFRAIVRDAKTLDVEYEVIQWDGRWNVTDRTFPKHGVWRRVD